jgi:diaminohydroxyphosphoribosylaminopyrimidine deaminase/5-amino-6-(5-phosphoribosylamino)uracil reductase
MSLDGKLATRTGESCWITGETARAHVHELRAEADAILAGIGTVLKDDPSLTARPKNLAREKFNPPKRVILDPQLQTPPTARLLQELADSPVWIFTAPSAAQKKKERWLSLGVRVETVACRNRMLDLRAVLKRLADENILSVFVEGGPRVHTSFLDQRLVNEALIYIAPLFIGGADAPTLYMGTGVATIKDTQRLEHVERIQLGPDTLIRGILRRALS